MPKDQTAPWEAMCWEATQRIVDFTQSNIFYTDLSVMTAVTDPSSDI